MLRRSGGIARRLLQQQGQFLDVESSADRAFRTFSRTYALPQGLVQASPVAWEAHFGSGNGAHRALHIMSSAVQQSAQPAVAEDTSSRDHQQQPPDPVKSSQSAAKSSEQKVGHTTITPNELAAGLRPVCWAAVESRVTQAQACKTTNH